MLLILEAVFWIIGICALIKFLNGLGGGGRYR